MRGFTSILAVASLAHLASATVNACRPNYCKKAIELQPAGIEECNSFLLTTVILPTETDYSTPSSVVTKTHTKTISETETDSKTESFQPSSVIWSTYTSVDVINSVTHTTTKKITTTSTTKFTKTTTTALSTTTTTTTTYTTTKAGGGGYKRSAASAEGPTPTTIIPSQTPEYAGVCHHVSRYARNCLSLGATQSVTTIIPAIDSEVLSSTIISTASADTSIIISSTLTKTTTKTLPSLHSTKTTTRTTTTVVSTSTSTTFTKTTTKTSTGIKTLTLGTTTTTTTKSTTSPTPYLLKVTGQTTSPGVSSMVGSYVDWITPSGSGLSNWPYNFALGFIDGASYGSAFVITPAGYLAVVYRVTSGLSHTNTPMLLTVVDGNYVVPTASPAANANLISCSLSTSGGTTTLANCNYNLYPTRYPAGNSYVTIMSATQDASPAGQLTFSLTATSY
ncbi:hypothetical protein Sste5346_009221 [Sporothrix stenoceras]|uniref:Uncharacterized protein n=1 Tax=Sporothrix stenoceras TaxID=5173 RepID=A0ABR3YKU5_9PEZI